eukprot:TRINITY_DN35998_c0_g1_i1.p1 TRINITY_DN35998_c0_g1~~TRINITY_DN35998_c0_g1_i1.p1  ORF type:complete len:479 (+),score=105.37 TRINITY_DN35998_c0_g1_i1:48-1484(+)
MSCESPQRQSGNVASCTNEEPVAQRGSHPHRASLRAHAYISSPSQESSLQTPPPQSPASKWSVVKRALRPEGGSQLRAAAFLVQQLRAELDTAGKENTELKSEVDALKGFPSCKPAEVAADAKALEEACARLEKEKASLAEELRKGVESHAAALEEIARLRSELNYESPRRSPTMLVPPIPHLPERRPSRDVLVRPESFYVGDAADPDSETSDSCDFGNEPATPRSAAALVPTEDTLGSSDWLGFTMVAELEAGEGVDRIGVGFRHLPPVALVVRKVSRGSWAERQGIRCGDEFMSVNHLRSRQYTASEFLNVMQRRPLHIRLKRSILRGEENEALIPGLQAGLPRMQGWVMVFEEEDSGSNDEGDRLSDQHEEEEEEDSEDDASDSQDHRQLESGPEMAQEAAKRLAREVQLEQEREVDENHADRWQLEGRDATEQCLRAEFKLRMQELEDFASSSTKVTDTSSVESMPMGDAAAGR